MRSCERKRAIWVSLKGEPHTPCYTPRRASDRKGAKCREQKAPLFLIVYIELRLTSLCFPPFKDDWYIPFGAIVTINTRI
jgi:hypothetical protein